MSGWSVVALAVAGAVGQGAARAWGRRVVGSAVVLGAALLVATTGALDALATRARSRWPLRFDGPPPIVVASDEVVSPLATPRAVALALLALALAFAVAWYLRRRSGEGPRDAFRLVPSLSTLRSPWILVVATPLALGVLAGLLSPARGFDALWYHLPLALGFARQRHLEPPGRDLVFYFPGNASLLGRTLLDALGPRALPLVQAPFAVVAATAAGSLARLLGARRRAALVATALVAGAPLVVFQAGMGYADLVSLAALAVAAALLVRGLPSLALDAAVGAGLALGLAVGAKYAALPLAAALAPPLAVAVVRALRRGASLRRAALFVALLALAVALPSWFWYARNLRLTGNPLFPIALPSLGLRGLFSSTQFNAGKELEFVPTRALWAIYPWIERTSHESGFGALVASLAPVGLALVAIDRSVRRWALRGRATLPLLWGAGYLVLWWVGTPHEPRHLAPLLVLLGAPLALVVDRPRVGRRLAPVALVALAFSSLATTRLLLFSRSELAARTGDAATAYDLPPAFFALVPPGALVDNRGGRPYNLPLAGPALDRRVRDFSPGWPTKEDVAYHAIDFVFYRGPQGGLPSEPTWELVYRAAPTVPWWDARPDDILALYRVPHAAR